MMFWPGRAVRSAAVVAAALLIAHAGNAAAAAVVFSSVAAGDPTSNSAILWTRTVEPATSQPVATGLTAQLAAEPEFRNILFSYKGVTDPARAGTIKIDAAGLKNHTHYFYRFAADDGSVSPTGQFTTAPSDDAKIAVRFAFSGDAHGAWRPYPLVKGFGESSSSIISCSSATRCTSRRATVRRPLPIRSAIRPRR